MVYKAESTTTCLFLRRFYYTSKTALYNISGSDSASELPGSPRHYYPPRRECSWIPGIAQLISQIPSQDLQAEILNLELHTVLLVLVQQTVPCSQKRHRGIREPDTFSGGSADDLWAFIFQCQIYFYAYDREFKEDSKKIYFAILYLRGIVRGHLGLCLVSSEGLFY